MDGLTAKVFRTYNASWTFVQELKDTPDDASIADKILAYNRANRRVAVLCNHQRSVSKGHGLMMEKMVDKVRPSSSPAGGGPLTARDPTRRRARSSTNARSSAARSSRPATRRSTRRTRRTSRTSRTTGSSSTRRRSSSSSARRSAKSSKRTTRRCVSLSPFSALPVLTRCDRQLEEGGEKPLPDSDLKERLAAADDLEKQLKSERKKGWKESKLNEDKLIAAIAKMDDRIQVSKTNMLDRDEGKEVSLGTSKINYIDPRLT